MILSIKFEGFEELENRLSELNSIRWEAIRKKQSIEMFNRAKCNSKSVKGGTPVDTRELLLSIATSNDEVGYTKEYAPHVEFGHRTKNGYVKGQNFLQDNVELQQQIYETDLINAIKREGN